MMKLRRMRLNGYVARMVEMIKAHKTMGAHGTDDFEGMGMDESVVL
jgi:hypothetical protein